MATQTSRPVFATHLQLRLEGKATTQRTLLLNTRYGRETYVVCTTCPHNTHIQFRLKI